MNIIINEWTPVSKLIPGFIVHFFAIEKQLGPHTVQTRTTHSHSIEILRQMYFYYLGSSPAIYILFTILLFFCVGCHLYSICAQRCTFFCCWLCNNK